MRTSSTERIDVLALVWLVVPRKQSPISGFAEQLKHLTEEAEERTRLAQESIARLQDRGLVVKSKRLELTEQGRRKALEALGLPKLPPKPSLQWVKRVLLLRSLDAEPTPAALKAVGSAEKLLAYVLVRHFRLERKVDLSSKNVPAFLAWRAFGLEKQDSFQFDTVFPAVFLGGASFSRESANGEGPASATIALKLSDCQLAEFASKVNDAARSSSSGRWHGAVFISHVWNTLQQRGDVGITFERFQKRLLEAHQADLLELSRADLVEAMPAADVSASETTTPFGARFHFIRLEQLAS